MTQFGRLGPTTPNEQAAAEEHLREVGEDIQHEKAADAVVKASTPAGAKRPWWKFWSKRSV
jgi:hypothetical protein